MKALGGILVVLAALYGGFVAMLSVPTERVLDPIAAASPLVGFEP
jgi:hypothetical protein